MAFGRKSPEVGTALDREELEALLAKISEATVELKTTMHELGVATRQANRVAEALNKAVNRANGAARGRMNS